MTKVFPMVSLLALVACSAAIEGSEGVPTSGGQPAGVDNDGDGVLTPMDCNDNDPSIHPLVELDDECDGVDNDCDGVADDDAPLSYEDLDEDGFGNPDMPLPLCTQGPSAVSNADDCNDEEPGVNPNGVEICDGLDNDCNGEFDDAGAEATVDGENLSFEEAMSLAVDGDSTTIQVCPGEIEVSSVYRFAGKQIVQIVGAMGRDATTITPTRGELAEARERSMFWLEGVTIADAHAPLVVRDQAMLQLHDAAVTGNSGSAIQVYGSAEDGLQATVSAVNSVFADNVSQQANGGVVSAEGSFGLTFDGCVIQDNDAPRGGAFWLWPDDSPLVDRLTLRNSVVQGNGGDAAVGFNWFAPSQVVSVGTDWIDSVESDVVFLSNSWQFGLDADFTCDLEVGGSYVCE